KAVLIAVVGTLGPLTPAPLPPRRGGRVGARRLLSQGEVVGPPTSVGSRRLKAELQLAAEFPLAPSGGVGARMRGKIGSCPQGGERACSGRTSSRPSLSSD